MELTDTPNCPYCGVPEPIEHFLLVCHRDYGARCIMKSHLTKLGTRNIDKTSILLGGGNINLEAKNKIAKALEKFCNSYKELKTYKA